METNKEGPQTLFDKIAPARAMQIAVSEYDAGRLVLTAPLAPNINDKGTGFAGSITSMLVLAGWGLVTQQLRDAGIEAEVVVSKSETTYKRPVRAALKSAATVESSAIRQLISDLKQDGRGRVRIEIGLSSEDTACAAMTATYVAVVKQGV